MGYYIRKKPISPWDALSYQDHQEVRRFVQQHPDGATFSDSGFAYFLPLVGEMGLRLEAAFFELDPAATGTRLVAPGKRLTSHGHVRVLEFEQVGDVLGLLGLDANDDVPATLGAQAK